MAALRCVFRDFKIFQFFFFTSIQEKIKILFAGFVRSVSRKALPLSLNYTEDLGKVFLLIFLGRL